MHWTYQDYQDTPQWFLDLLLPIVETEQKVATIKMEMDSRKQGSK